MDALEDKSLHISPLSVELFGNSVHSGQSGGFLRVTNVHLSSVEQLYLDPWPMGHRKGFYEGGSYQDISAGALKVMSKTREMFTTLTR